MNNDDKLALIELIDKAQELKLRQNYPAAIDCYENILKIDPQISSIYSILANLYSKAFGNKSLDKQISCYLELLKYQPKSSLALHGLAFCYEKLKDNTNAEKYYKILLDNEPTEIDYYNYGMFLIHNGDFVNGHKYFTRRFNINDVNLRYPVQIEGDKRWDFETDLSDKTLLVHYEQGFGDTIMYCRFIPWLAKFAKKLVFAVQEELFTLIEGAFEDVEIVTEHTISDYDYSMALLDAPYVLGTTTEAIPCCEGYLGKDIDVIKGHNFRIGISYAGDKNSNYAGRDIKLERFQDLISLDRVEIYSLQKDETEIVKGIYPLGRTFKDFRDTAEAIKSMDLIISSDNVILNLAGALGVKTIGLFNYETNFRWYKTTGSDVGWYKSVMPLQCRREDEWDELFERLRAIVQTELTIHK